MIEEKRLGDGGEETIIIKECGLGLGRQAAVMVVVILKKGDGEWYLGGTRGGGKRGSYYKTVAVSSRLF